MDKGRKIAVLFGGALLLSLLVLVAAPELGLEPGERRAAREITEVMEALEAYRTATGAYPVGNNFVIIRALTGERDGPGGPIYLELRGFQRDDKGRMLDPWGVPYDISVNPINGQPRVRSAGPNGLFTPGGDTDDDIRSWEVAQ